MLGNFTNEVQTGTHWVWKDPGRRIRIWSCSLLLGDKGIFSLPLSSSSLQEINIFKGQMHGFIFHLDSFWNADRFCIGSAFFPFVLGQVSFRSTSTCVQTNEMSLKRACEKGIWWVDEPAACLWAGFGGKQTGFSRAMGIPLCRTGQIDTTGQIVTLVAARGNRIYRIRTGAHFLLKI